MNLDKKGIIINSRKYDGVINRSWQVELIQNNEFLLTFIGVFESEINHPSLGIIRHGTVSYEYYWTNRWYNIFRFHEPEGALRNYYCNINQPPILSDAQLDYVDLDVDIVVWRDLSYEVLDLDEFNENSKIYGYSKHIIVKVQESLAELVDLIENKKFPFNYNASNNPLNF